MALQVRNREEAAKASLADSTNDVGMCQQQTRLWLLGPSAGDRDGDGDADAVDGWKSEPVDARHPGDRHPPRGVPVSWAGGRKGHGHRALSLGDGMVRSTDAGGAGRVASVHLSWVEQNWGMQYLGWSETITGIMIPPAPPAPKPKPTRLSHFHAQRPFYDLKKVERAAKAGRKDRDYEKILSRIRTAVRQLPEDKGNTRVFQFVQSYTNNHVLRMHLLHKAVNNGRHGVVEHVRDELRHQIALIPKR